MRACAETNIPGEEGKQKVQEPPPWGPDGLPGLSEALPSCPPENRR